MPACSTISLEICRSVSDYLKSADHDLDQAFEDCQSAPWELPEIQAEVAADFELIGFRQCPRGLEFSEPEFIEFDSGRSHASGYWSVEVTGAEQLIERLRAAFDSEICL